MSKIVIALASPSIEVLITANEVSGRSSSIKVGFSRYSREQAKLILQYLNSDGGVKRESLLEIESFKAWANLEGNEISEINDSDILTISTDYISEAPIEVEGKAIKADTRNPTCDVALEELLPMYIGHCTFFGALTQGFIASLVGYTGDHREDDLKN